MSRRLRGDRWPHWMTRRERRWWRITGRRWRRRRQIREQLDRHVTWL